MKKMLLPVFLLVVLVLSGFTSKSYAIELTLKGETAIVRAELRSGGCIQFFDFDGDGIWDSIFVWSTRGKLAVYENPKSWASLHVQEPLTEKEWFQGFRNLKTGKPMSEKTSREIERIVGPLGNSAVLIMEGTIWQWSDLQFDDSYYDSYYDSSDYDDYKDDK